MLQRFRVGLAVENSSYFNLALNLDLYVCRADSLMCRSPSRGSNNLYVYKLQHDLGRGLLLRGTGLSYKKFITDRSNALLLLLFIQIVTVRPPSVCLQFDILFINVYLGQGCGHLLGKSCPLGCSLVLILF